jgi:phosphatidylserine/phosphatidylglycerophosphate/cardiolipin synthase-like enzyme
MQVETVTAAGFGLLEAVRATLASSMDAMLCVAFAHERGVRLLGQELEAARKRGGRLRLLVTTAFDRGGTTAGALAVARELGAEVRIHNHAGGTYHPKLYLGASGDRASAVIGSANLTAGLACNVEVGVALTGKRSERPIARAWAIGEGLWSDARSLAWQAQAADAAGEELAPELLAALAKAKRLDPVIRTLGPNPRPNRLVEVTPSEVLVETERTQREGTAPQPVPAWMLNLAWEYLQTRGEITNTTLLSQLRVHRSSAVCAMLARVPGVEVASVRPITLRWRAGTRTFSS